MNALQVREAVVRAVQEMEQPIVSRVSLEEHDGVTGQYDGATVKLGDREVNVYYSATAACGAWEWRVSCTAHNRDKGTLRMVYDKRLSRRTLGEALILLNAKVLQ